MYQHVEAGSVNARTGPQGGTGGGPVRNNKQDEENIVKQSTFGQLLQYCPIQPELEKQRKPFLKPPVV